MFSSSSVVSGEEKKMNVAINAQEGPLLNATYMIRFSFQSQTTFSRAVLEKKRIQRI